MKSGAIDAITKHGEVEAWIVDDAGMLKQGKHSVGLHPQYVEDDSVHVAA